ncbi:hypothetical protein ACFFSW_17230 [Saccharothrix longispora]|uniref:Transposase n=1 Tax=Saccharothrix longispora TaxID=33920 RepID=A0ABU1PSI7_9PSEU|nr:hypothetical protein [Saccharothrix longispora]MDR6593612.1 hypothetical protein [Saccharothrix longispora]
MNRPYARVASGEDSRYPPTYRRGMVAFYREHCQRLTRRPDVPVTHLLAESRVLGYSGSANLLDRYLRIGTTQSAASDRRALRPSMAFQCYLDQRRRVCQTSGSDL